jgi:pyruvate dehydrogenase E2 component (dihydrolipoamide acetyltransferase)
LLPDLGEGLTDAEIITWLVSVGDQVQIDQPVVEVETAKAAVEVPVPFAGRVSAVFGAPGERIAVGSPLISVETAAVPSAAHAVSAADAAASSEYSGNVLIGYGTSAGNRRRTRVRRPLPATAGNPASAAVADPVLSVPSVISPVVRKLARDRGIDLATVNPSDPSGVIRRADLDAVTTAPETIAERIPLSGLRRVVADKLSRSRREIPEATVWVDVDATGLLAARRTLDVSLLALVSRFCVLGLTKYRELNSRITSDAVELLPEVNLGFAAQTEKGLVVPVIHGAQRLSTRQLSAALSEHTATARAGRLTPAQLTGGTFTVNNYGVFGVDGSAAIINYPEVAILGIGQVIDRPWVVDGELAVRKVTQLTLAFDHRACDGGVAGGFLRFIADCVENPITALADL